MVTLGFAFLAHGFGIVGALQPHRQTISEKARAVRTDEDLLLLNLFDVEIPEGKGSFFSVMVLPTEDRHEFQQRPDIGLPLF